MSLWTPFAPTAQQFSASATNGEKFQGPAPSGSWTGFTLGAMCAAALVFCAASFNAGHAWELGLHHSTFRAVVLATASVAAAVLAPLCFLVVAKGRGFGTRILALCLGVGCVGYTAVSSVGFIAGARYAGVSEHRAATESRAGTRVELQRLLEERAALPPTVASPAAVRAAQAAVAAAERAREAECHDGRGRRCRAREATEGAARKRLAETLASRDAADRRAAIDARAAALRDELAKAPAQADAQATALAFYAAAAGWPVRAETVGPWVNLGMVLFLELAAACSLTVAASLRPAARIETERKKEEKHDADDDRPPPKRGGRPRDVQPAQAVERLKAAGGKLNGSVRGVGKALGSRSKTSAHRLLCELRDMGLIELTAGRRGVAVSLA